MIKITIEKTIVDKYEVQQNLVTKRTPTEITEESHSSYSGTTKKVQFVEEFAPGKVTETRSRTVTLLEQEIEDDTAFNLQTVIASINNMKIQE